MEADLSSNPAWLEYIQSISGTVWLAAGLLFAALVWLLKWAVTVLFVQGRGVSLITIPFSRVAGKILEDRFAQKLADTKALPKLHIPATWEEFNRFNGYVAHRMRTYRELIYLVHTKFNGPSAVSMRLVVRYFEQSFIETFSTAEKGFRDLDRIDDRVRAVHRGIHRDLQDRTERLERDRIQAEKDYEMMRIRKKHVIANRPTSLWLRRRTGQLLGGFLSFFVNWLWSSSEAKALKAEHKRLRTRLRDLQTEIAEEERKIFSEHEAEVVGVCLELIEHDRKFLQHLYHRFGLEVDSLSFTVASGRVLELLAEGSERGERARAELNLGHLADPGALCDADTVRSHVRSDRDLTEYVGLGPEAVLEGTLEPYLRVKLLLGHVEIPGYSPHWVAHLPPPGEFGRAQQEYGHFAHQLAWLKKPIPGLQVLANGLVIMGEKAPLPSAAE